MNISQETSPTVWALKLKSRSSDLWLHTVLDNFGAFLQDHATCERKAAATCLGFVVKFKDNAKLVDQLSDLAIEELEHFRQVKDLLKEYGLEIGGDEKDEYVNLFLTHARNDLEGRLMDRLLIFGIIEARATERFGLIARTHSNPKMKSFYHHLASVEAQHQALFVDLCLEFFSNQKVYARLEELLQIEANILETLPVHAKLH
jgi:tRNA-(ms[2]io[6]A)-hydroxylase